MTETDKYVRLIVALEIIAERLDELDTRLMAMIEAISDSGSLIQRSITDWDRSE